MRLSWRVATVRGIDLKVHATFALALLWGAFVWNTGTPASALYGVFLTLLLFAVVVLHEFAHAFTAQHYGIEVYDIVLLPVGGVARLSNLPEKPAEELWVALAGPAVNLALALLLAPFVLGGLALQMLHGFMPAWPSITTPGLDNIAAFLLLVNISLFLFNMLPAFPMDGGRVLRALMAMRWSYARSTQVAVIIGRAFALAFAALAIYTMNLFLGLVAVFVFAGAGSESRRDEEPGEELLPLAADTSSNPAGALLSNTPAYLAFDRLLRSPTGALVVVNDRGDLLGLVTRTGMESRWAAGVRGPVSQFVEPLGAD